MSEEDISAANIDLVFEGLDTFAVIKLVRRQRVNVFTPNSTLTNDHPTLKNGCTILEFVAELFEIFFWFLFPFPGPRTNSCHIELLLSGC
jgi:hypothetical protein